MRCGRHKDTEPRSSRPASPARAARQSSSNSRPLLIHSSCSSVISRRPVTAPLRQQRDDVPAMHDHHRARAPHHVASRLHFDTATVPNAAVAAAGPGALRTSIPPRYQMPQLPPLARANCALRYRHGHALACAVSGRSAPAPTPQRLLTTRSGGTRRVDTRSLSASRRRDGHRNPRDGQRSRPCAARCCEIPNAERRRIPRHHGPAIVWYETRVHPGAHNGENLRRMTAIAYDLARRLSTRAVALVPRCGSLHGATSPQLVVDNRSMAVGCVWRNPGKV
jgi:hypothetical protein